MISQVSSILSETKKSQDQYILSPNFFRSYPNFISNVSTLFFSNFLTLLFIGSSTSICHLYRINVYEAKYMKNSLPTNRYRHDSKHLTFNVYSFKKIHRRRHPFKRNGFE